MKWIRGSATRQGNRTLRADRRLAGRQHPVGGHAGGGQALRHHRQDAGGALRRQPEHAEPGRGRAHLRAGGLAVGPDLHGGQLLRRRRHDRGRDGRGARGARGDEQLGKRARGRRRGAGTACC
jgi:hypothetical protein